MAVIAIAIPMGPGRTTGHDLVRWLHRYPWVDPTKIIASPPSEAHKDLSRAVGRALIRLPGESANEWVLHMEDDTYPGPDFHKVPDYLDAADPDVGSVSFFGFRDGPDGVRDVARLWGAQCVAVRSSVLRGIASLEAQTYAKQVFHRPPEQGSRSSSEGDWWSLGAAERYQGEAILDAAIRASGLRMTQVWPSLADHRDRPSTAGYHGHRYSRSYRRVYGELPEEAH